MKKTFATALILLCLLTTIAVNLHFAKAQPTLPTLPPPIYIQSDGSINPSTAPIQRTGNTYTLEGDVNNTIQIQQSNTIFNGNGFNITNPVNAAGPLTPIGYLPGIAVYGVSNVTITDTAFDNCITGITIQNSTAIAINRNTIEQTLTGIAVLSSSNLNIEANEILLSNSSGAIGMSFLPADPQSFTPYQINIEGNQITGGSSQAPATPYPQPRQWGIWGGFNQSNVTRNSINDLYGIALYYTGSNNVIKENNLQNNYDGLFFTGDADLSVNNIIYENNFIQNTANAVVPWIDGPPPGNNWDNGTVGNYWSDYNGTELDNSGLGGTPYIIQTVYMNYTLNENETVWEGQDNHPLINPINIPYIATGVLELKSQSSKATPAQTSLPLNSTSSIPELTWLMIAPLLFSALLVALAHRHRKTHLKQLNTLNARA